MGPFTQREPGWLWALRRHTHPCRTLPRKSYIPEIIAETVFQTYDLRP